MSTLLDSSDALRSVLGKSPMLYIVGALCLAIYLLFPMVWKPMRANMVEEGTAANDLPYLGKPRKEGKVRGTCVVAGAR